MKKPELLAPAGDMERLKIAFHYGADAVYIGGPLLGLRANAINFTFDEIKEACNYAHNLGKKVYVTVNIVLHNKEVEKVEEYLKKLEEYNVDAIIASDLTVIKLALEKTNLVVHLSTQASTMNYKTALFYKNMGVKRIVLAREMNREEIKKIKQNVDIELECFIHGAMCAGISGRCVLSNIFTNRDANRGGCAQVCRWDFNLVGDNNLLKGEKDFTFCAKDLSLLKYLPNMIEDSIDSLKIEGRMRSIYYIATIVGIYRKNIDKFINNKDTYKYNKEDEIILRNCANRDSVAQFYNNTNDYKIGYFNGRQEISNQDFLGIVLDYNKDTKMALIEERNYFKKGDTAILFGPNHDEYEFIINEIIDENNEQIEIVRHPMQKVYIKIDFDVQKWDLIRLKNGI